MRSRMLLGIIVSASLAFACAQSDAGVTASVKGQLVADELVKARRIDVDTRDRIVTLTGQVRSREEASKALAIARNTEGVADVMNRLTIASGTEMAAPTTGAGALPPAAAAGVDSGITTRVKAKLLADPDVSGLKIDVDTRAGVVTLTGTVNTQAEKSEALELVRQTDGVTDITDRITVRRRQY
jgi:hyperosmotically inducible protein